MQYNHKVIGIVSMDLSKAFDTLSHDLIVLKLKQYQLDDKRAIFLIEGNGWNLETFIVHGRI